MKTIIMFCLWVLSMVMLYADEMNTKYIFAYFKGNGEDGLHLAESQDGYVWKTLAGDSSFLVPQVGGRLMRDPNIILGGDGFYHMVWTVSWKGQAIGYSKSKDLRHWCPQQLLPVMRDEPGTRNCWAPEITYDKNTDTYLIYWLSTIESKFTETAEMKEDNYSHRIYATTTRDFKTFTPTVLLYDPGFSVIDATILIQNGKYYMFVKDETLTPAKKNIRVAVADRLVGPYSVPSESITGDYWCEGPTVLAHEGKITVYFDKYTHGCYGAVESVDLKHWGDISHKVVFPEGARHGSVIEVPASIWTDGINL